MLLKKYFAGLRELYCCAPPVSGRLFNNIDPKVTSDCLPAKKADIGQGSSTQNFVPALEDKRYSPQYRRLCRGLEVESL